MKAGTQLLKMSQEEGPFPAGLVLHSFLGPPHLVKPFSEIQGCYFSISGHSLRSPKKAPQLLSQVLLENPIPVQQRAWDRCMYWLWTSNSPCSVSAEE